MQLKTLFILLSTATLACSAAIPSPVVDDFTIQIFNDIDTSHGFDPNVRGNVPDFTDLKTDVVPEESLPLVTRQTPELEAITDSLLFEQTITQFLGAKSRKIPNKLNWDDNGCSSSPDHPFGFNFLHSCMRHDFGYRNYKGQGRFTEENRKKIDEQFLEDLTSECKNSHDGAKEAACIALAGGYFAAVRAFGWL